MDFVFVDDIARANTMAANSSITDDVINVASGVETSLTELAETLGRVMGVNLPPEYGPARKATPVWRRLADVSKAHRRLDSERKFLSKMAFGNWLTGGRTSFKPKKKPLQLKIAKFVRSLVIQLNVSL